MLLIAKGQEMNGVSRYFQFTRVPDGSIVRFMQEIMADYDDSSATFSLLDHISFSLNSEEELPEKWKEIFKSSSHLITHASLSIPLLNMTIGYYRGQTYVTAQGWRAGENPFVDGLDVNGPQQNPNAALPILSSLTKFMSGSAPLPLANGVSDAFEQSSIILNRISEAAASLVEHTADRAKSLDRRQEMLQDNVSIALDSRLRELEEQFSRKQMELSKEKADFEERVKSINDRSNTHARRDLQKAMAAQSTEALQKGLLPKSENSYFQSILIALAFAATLLILAFLQGRSIVDSANNNIVIFSEIRVILLGLGSGALIWYALRLSSTRYRQIGKLEHDLNRHLLDTERAGFLLEGDLEARQANGEGLPEVMLDRFSRGLFADSDSSSDSRDAVGDTLSALLGRAASIKVGTSGFEATVDKSGLKKARKDVEGEGGEA